MTIYRKLILTVLAILIVHAVKAQNITLRKAPNFQTDLSVNQTDLPEIMKSIEKTLNEYAEAGKLIDPEQRRVTEASIDRFNKLFTPNARVLKDYAEFIPTDLISYKDYSLEVFNMLKLKGVEMTIQSAELISLKADALGFYIPEVIVRKNIFNSLSSDGSINSIATGRPIELRFTFDILREDLGRANINRIAPRFAQEEAERFTRVIQISTGVGSGTYSPSLSSYWNQAHTESSLNASGGINFSLGAELMTDQFITPRSASKRNLAFSVGLRFASYQMQSELRSFSIEPFEQIAMDGGDTQRYLRLVGPVVADEDIRFGVLEIPLGIAYKLMKKQTSMVYIHARFIPSFVLSGSGDLTGDGFYRANFFNDDNGGGAISEFTVPGDQATFDDAVKATDGFAPFRVGEYDLGFDAEPELASTVFAFQLSPTAYFNFSDDDPGWGILVGVDLNYHFNSFIKHNPISTTLENPFKYDNQPEEFEGSLMNYFAEDMSGFSFGIRIGLFQRLSIDP